MIGGTYNISMKMFDEIETGTVEFIESGGKLSGTLKAGSIVSSFSDGIINGNHFEFSGIIQKFIFKIQYTARGDITQDRLTAEANTKHGVFKITGERIK
ncbi:MAG: hypothetical protein PHR18_00640 [Oscillospiraceae bacterium]|nr:hypothetical protein [Oscillospiraceae bacterium]MDD3832390.1 hypothetical protein [Oscillospiraceae bacterium]